MIGDVHLDADGVLHFTPAERMTRHADVVAGSFIEDWDYDARHPYDAVAFGPPWNGWATPIVTLATLHRIEAVWAIERARGERIARIDFPDAGNPVLYPSTDHHGGPGERVRQDEEERDDDAFELVPDADGNYDLGAWGFCFVRHGGPGGSL